MEKKVFINGRWAHVCPKCGESISTECNGEGRTYNGNTAELIEDYYCADCGIYFSIVSEMLYKYHIIDE